MRTQSIVLLMILSAGAQGQWLHHRDASLPRLADGKPNVNAEAPTVGGKPDLSGLWIARPNVEGQFVQGVEEGYPPKYFISVAGGFGPGVVPMTPWAAGVLGQRMSRHGIDQPTTWCKPVGTPRLAAFPAPYKIVQTPKLILLLYEMDTVFRQVFLDGRELPQDQQPSYQGYSVGRWDGDVLVVTTTGFNGEGWLDAIGHPFTGALRMEERYHRTSVGRMDVEVTLTDPAAYTETLRYTQPQVLLPDTDLIESFCTENEKDQPHLVAN